MTDDEPTPSTVLIGGVSQLFQGDLDLGRLAVGDLADEAAPPSVTVEELHYGAVAVAQRLEELRPGTLVLVGAAERGRQPGTVERRFLDPPRLPLQEAQHAVEESITGYVSLDLVVEVADALGAFPPRVVAVEAEPATTGPSDELSDEAARALPEVVDRVRREVRRVPLFDLAAQLRGRLAAGELAPSPALQRLEVLLDELRHFERHGRWGRISAERDRFQACLTAGETGEDVTKLDWARWWTLIELVGAEQGREAAVG